VKKKHKTTGRRGKTKKQESRGGEASKPLSIYGDDEEQNQEKEGMTTGKKGKKGKKKNQKDVVSLVGSVTTTTQLDSEKSSALEREIKLSRVGGGRGGYLADFAKR